MKHVFVKSAFEPEELAELKATFDNITSQPWFDQSEGAKAAFAKYLIETVPISVDARRYRSIVEASARMFYSAEQTAA